MRAIIIEEDRFTEIVELLRYEAERMLAERCPDGVEPAVWRTAVGEAHRSFNYHLVTWAQSHGARCTR